MTIFMVSLTTRSSIQSFRTDFLWGENSAGNFYSFEAAKSTIYLLQLILLCAKLLSYNYRLTL